MKNIIIWKNLLKNWKHNNFSIRISVSYKYCKDIALEKKSRVTISFNVYSITFNQHYQRNIYHHHFYFRIYRSCIEMIKSLRFN